MKCTLVENTIAAKETKQGECYLIESDIYLRLNGKSLPRFARLKDGYVKVYDYNKAVTPLVTEQPVIFKL